MLQATAGRKTTSRQLSRLQARERGAAEEEISENSQNYNGNGVPLKRTTPGVSFASLRGSTHQQHQPQALQAPTTGQPATEKKSVPAPAEPQRSGQSVCGQNVNSQHLDSMMRVVTVIQQIMTEYSGAVSEEDKIMAITKIVLNLTKQNCH
jgi:hypothetical protein